MVAEYRYAGPDGEGIADLPDGVGAVLGNEYCVHLVPAPAKLEGAIAEAGERGIPLLLLTPYFRDAELKNSVALFRAIPEGTDIDVAVNDWGALLALHTLFPSLRLSLGRLLSGQKRCPRIGSSPVLTTEGRAWQWEGIFTSARARNHLEEAFGISGYHIDALAWGPTLADPDVKTSGGDLPCLYLHAPYAIVTVSDACPWIGGKSSASVPSCPRPCRDGAVLLREPSMGGELIQRGKARFVRYGPSGSALPDAETRHSLVVHDDPP
jgi:hypothetical protein